MNPHRQIKKRLRAGGTYRGLGLEYGVTAKNVGCIARGETWRHVT